MQPSLLAYNRPAVRGGAGTMWATGGDAAAVEMVAQAELQAIQFSRIATLPWLRHGVTQREGVGLAGNVAFSRGPTDDAVLAARQRWAERIGLDPEALVTARQVHGRSVEHVTAAQRGRGARSARDLPDADALVTGSRDVALMAVFADCVPVVLVDPVGHAVGIAHAGWRGAVAGVTEAAVGAMAAHCQSDPSNLLAGIGPSIGPCCYAVGADVATAAAQGYGAEVLRPGPTPDNPILDLWLLTRRALRRAGLRDDLVETLGLCTRCHNDRFFSHRAQGPTRGLFGVMIGLV